MRERQEGLNEASVAAMHLPTGLFLAVADARGPSSESILRAGQVALQLLRTTLQGSRVSTEDAPGIQRMLRQALRTTNSQLHSLTRTEQTLRGTNCSIALVLIAAGGAYIAHVGDCRVYLVREGRALRMTEDHTKGGEWIAHGVMTDQQVRHHPDAHKVTRSLGSRSEIEPSVRGLMLKLEKGDVLVLASSEVHRHIDDAELGRMTALFPPQDLCERVCEEAAERGGTPDCRAVVYGPGGRRRKGALVRNRPPAASKTRRMAAIALVLVALATAVALAFGLFGDKTPSPQPDALTAPVPDLTTATATHPDVRVPPEVRGQPEQPPTPDVKPRPEVKPQPDVKPQPEVAPQPDIKAHQEVQQRPDIKAQQEVQQQPDIRAQQEVQQQPDIKAQQEIHQEPDAQAHADVQAPPELKAPPEIQVQPEEPEITSTDAVTEYRPHGPARDCNTMGLAGVEARATEKVARTLERAFDKVSGKRPSTSKAVEGYFHAVDLLNSSPPVAWERCGWPVKELRNRIKKRYLRMANSAALKAAQNPDKREKFCRSGKKRARDARKFGATETEAKKSLGRCADQ